LATRRLESLGIAVAAAAYRFTDAIMLLTLVYISQMETIAAILDVQPPARNFVNISAVDRLANAADFVEACDRKLSTGVAIVVFKFR
jgi:hypothetical protein